MWTASASRGFIIGFIRGRNESERAVQRDDAARNCLMVLADKKFWMFGGGRQGKPQSIVGQGFSLTLVGANFRVRAS